MERASITAAAKERKGWEEGSERACEGGGGAQTTGDRVSYNAALQHTAWLQRGVNRQTRPKAKSFFSELAPPPESEIFWLFTSLERQASA